MSFRVTLSETAARQLRKLPREQGNRIPGALRVLEQNPFRPRPRADIRIIEGTVPRKYRIRIGDYRAVYAVLGTEVIEVFLRGRGYRRPSRPPSSDAVLYACWQGESATVLATITVTRHAHRGSTLSPVKATDPRLAPLAPPGTGHS